MTNTTALLGALGLALAASATRPNAALPQERSSVPEPHLSWSGGLLGHSVELTLQGQAGAGFTLFVPARTPAAADGPSFAAGAPADAPDLTGMMAVRGKLDPSGSATESLRLLEPELRGRPWRAFFFEERGFTTHSSNEIRFTVAAPGDTYGVAGPNVGVRPGRTMTKMADGRVLLAGGFDDRHEATADWFVFDPQVESYTASGSLPAARARHSATLLDDGRVLLVGGVGDGGDALSDSVLFNPQTARATVSASMAAPRVLHTATRLGDGRVLVTGGSEAYDSAHPIGFPESILGSLSGTTELFDPVGEAWISGPDLPAPITGHRASPFGRGVLLTGGLADTRPMRRTTDQCLFFDETTGALTAMDPLPEPVAFHAQSETTTGGVFFAGGCTFDFGLMQVRPSLEVHGIEPTPGSSTLSYMPSSGITGVWIDGCIVCVRPNVYGGGGGYGMMGLAGGGGSPYANGLIFNGGYEAGGNVPPPITPSADCFVIVDDFGGPQPDPMPFVTMRLFRPAELSPGQPVAGSITTILADI
ncbi:MAG: kelch repeat-containing protein [Planctomycetota bacterium]